MDCLRSPTTVTGRSPASCSKISICARLVSWNSSTSRAPTRSRSAPRAAASSTSRSRQERVRSSKSRAPSLAFSSRCRWPAQSASAARSRASAAARTPASASRTASNASLAELRQQRRHLVRETGAELALRPQPHLGAEAPGPVLQALAEGAFQRAQGNALASLAQEPARLRFVEDAEARIDPRGRRVPAQDLAAERVDGPDLRQAEIAADAPPGGLAFRQHVHARADAPFQLRGGRTGNRPARILSTRSWTAPATGSASRSTPFSRRVFVRRASLSERYAASTRAEGSRCRSIKA